MAYRRDRGFPGLFTIFSNGVKAEKPIAILDSYTRREAVLPNNLTTQQPNNLNPQRPPWLTVRPR